MHVLLVSRAWNASFILSLKAIVDSERSLNGKSNKHLYCSTSFFEEKQKDLPHARLELATSWLHNVVHYFVASVILTYSKHIQESGNANYVSTRSSIHVILVPEGWRVGFSFTGTASGLDRNYGCSTLTYCAHWLILNRHYSIVTSWSSSSERLQL